MDLTVAATPGYFGTMALEAAYLRRRAEARGPSPADYERRDTIASLSMGVASLVAPLVLQKLLKPVTPGKGRFGKALAATAVGAIAVTTIADAVARRDAGDHDTRPNRETRRGKLARKIAKVAGVTSVVAGGVAITSTFASRTTPDRMWKRRVVRDLGTGPVALDGRGARLGLHLLLEPPVHAREPVHVGDPRRAPLERALQPVDRAAPARRRRVRHVPALQRCSRCSGSGPA